MDTSKTIKSSQEQAAAAWIDYLNQVRVTKMVESLGSNKISTQEELTAALGTIDNAMKSIDAEIIARNRGGEYGMHGFIAEVAEEGAANARRLIVGEEANLKWVNDNGPVDLLRDNTVQIQQKFVNAGGQFSLNAVARHLQKYPDFVNNGGKYQIPSDHYEQVKTLFEMSKREASRLTRVGDGPSLKDWEQVNRFFNETGLTPDDLEPSCFSYAEVQKNTIHATLDVEKDELKAINKERRKQLDSEAYEEGRPSFKEGAKATIAAAAVEGLTTFLMAVQKKRSKGKRLRELDASDWEDITKETGIGFGKGGVRGASIYLLTNYKIAPAAVASAVVTSAFGVAEQAYQMHRGEIGEVEFVDNAEMLCLEAAVSALSSLVGQAVIPVPVLGAVIGNAVGVVMYQAAKDGFSAREQAIVEAYVREQRELDAKLEKKYGRFLDSLNASMSSYLVLLDHAFNPNPVLAFEGSISLAMELGVPTDRILDTREKIRSFFMD